MPSEVAWLDYSEDERRRMREVIDLFREKETLDELGIGGVRDAFSNLLFPGTSTIQTRARYFLFIPWIYLGLERDRTPSHEAAAKARRRQSRLVDALKAGGEGSAAGVIGYEAGEHLKRLPSSVYWNGLKTFGIRLFRGSTDDYHRSLDQYHRRVQRERRAESTELYERLPGNWHAGLPEAPEGLLETATLALNPFESEYLRERIVAAQPRSLLAYLVSQPRFAHDTGFPWNDPGTERAPDHLLEWLEHARNFSEAIHGAALLYNLMLADRAVKRGLSGDYEDLVDLYEALLSEWSEQLKERSDSFAAWDRRRFWEIVTQANPRVSIPTRSFIDTWLGQAVPKPGSIIASKPLRDLIDHREASMKGSQARLRNNRALENWNGQSGTAQLDYRWRVTARLLTDIHDGLGHRA